MKGKREKTVASGLIPDAFFVGHEARRYKSKRTKNVASGFIPDVGVHPRRFDFNS
jgi:hypothetical protein